MVPRRYPAWETPAIEEWRDAYPPIDYSRHCLPLPILTIGAVGALGAFAFCHPHRSCLPRSECYPYSCAPYIACTPTHICHPRSCYPYAG